MVRVALASRQYFRRRYFQWRYVRGMRLLLTREGAGILCGLALMGFLLLQSGAAAAQPRHKTSGPTDSGDRAYEGTLSCLRPDRSAPEVTITNCQEGGQHERILVMQQGYVHLLYGVNEELQTKIHADTMLGKTIKVKGKIDPITRAILVSEIVPEK